jgi:hypothetical protein
MKVQHYINTSESAGWYRCKRVEFAGETATWELSQTSRYSFLEAYQMTPHRQLIQADNDPALRAFVKSWGPLRPKLDVWSGNDPIEMYRRKRDSLTANVRLLASVEEPQMQRSALVGLSEISRLDSNFETSLDIPLAFLRTEFPIPGSASPGFDPNIRQWLETAQQEQIEAATVFLVSAVPLSLPVPRFSVERQRRGNILKASLGIDSLADALSWMVWQDVFQSHPFQFCAECRQLFQPDTRHEKKFCSQQCAHRKTAREWQQRKRNKERRTNGTHKTR